MIQNFINKTQRSCHFFNDNLFIVAMSLKRNNYTKKYIRKRLKKQKLVEVGGKCQTEERSFLFIIVEFHKKFHVEFSSQGIQMNLHFVSH